MVSRPAETSWNQTDSHRDGKAKPATGWSPILLHGQLGVSHAGPVGPGRDTRVCDTVYGSPSSALPSDRYPSFLRQGESLAGRDREHACEAGDRENLTHRAGLPVNSIAGTEKGRGPEARNKFEVLEQLCAHRALQNGGHSCPERPAQTRGQLDGEGRFEGRIFHAPDMRGGQSIPQVLAQRPDILVQVPTVRPGVCPLGLHQDPQASSCPAETTGSANFRLHRRHLNPGRVQGTGQGPRDRLGVPPGESRLCSEQCQVPIGADTGHRVSRLHGKLTQPGVELTCRQDQEDQGRNTIPARKQDCADKKTVATLGKTPSCDVSNSPRTTVFLQAPARVEAWSGSIRSGLFATADALRG